MKVILMFLMTLTSGAFASDNVTVKDLTGQKYKGPDDSLSMLDIQNMRSRCADGYDDTPDFKIISWKMNNHSNNQRRLKKYTMYLRVVDRQGKEVFNGSFPWDSTYASKPGYVSEMLCEENGQPGNSAVAIPLKSIQYANIEYWIDSIEIEKLSMAKEEKGKKPAAEGSSGMGAFTIEEAVRDAQERRRN